MKLVREGEVAVLEMAGSKANAMSREWLEALAGTLDQVGDASAVVLIGFERFFSAGLALPTLLPLSPPELVRFIDLFNATMLRVFELPCPVVAAVNGHAIAGGCVLALQADWRVMTADPVKIGLNEVALGIGLPAGVVETLRCRVPASSLVPIALEGRLFGPAEALALGLVNEVVPAGEVRARAVARERELGSQPREAYASIKAALARPVLAAIRLAQEDSQRWVAGFFSDTGQALIRAAVARFTRA